MKAITIDQLGIETHERYAKDQEVFDPTFIKEAAPHSQILGTSSIYSSEWEKLFACNLGSHPWAAFASPPQFFPLSRRGFFSFSLAPSLGKTLEVREEEENQSKKVEAFLEQKNRLLHAKLPHRAGATLEKERSTLFALFLSMENLNDLLQEINSRKLQYQKG